MGEEAVKTHQNYFRNTTYFADFIKLDTSNQKAEDTVEKIISEIS
jgi:hypothetical protein